MIIDVVLVTYKPDRALLEKVLKSISSQVRRVVIVDNGSFLNFDLLGDIKLISLIDNKGISFAQNLGIKDCINAGADYILLSDQDTVYPYNYVSSMLPLFEENHSACVIVPKFHDGMKKNSDGFIAIKPIIFQQFFPVSGQHEIFQAIASGKILKASVLEDIGLMNEDLFIDWVDLEWCWRARAKGYKIIGNADVIIQHQLGDMSKDLGFREVNLRSPMRHYYITRNSFYLSIYSKDLDLLHRITLFFKSFRYIVGFPTLSKPHLMNLKAVLLGFWHGITKRLGKYDL